MGAPPALSDNIPCKHKVLPNTQSEIIESSMLPFPNNSKKKDLDYTPDHVLP